jgi:antitoxin MazE
MKAELVRIGNSRGIRIPKPIIEQCSLGDTVELQVHEGRLIISPERSPRQGWEAAFRDAGSSRRDPILLKSLPADEFDREEWEW